MTYEYNSIHEGKKYKVLNCPAYNPNGGYYDCFWNQLSWCENIDDCLIKKIINECNEIYRTSEYFEELAEKGDKEQELIESCWHNAAHIVMSKVKIKEVEVNEK